MTAKHLIKKLAKKGNKVLGVGCYSAVVEFTSSPEKVFKIGNDAADPFLEYVYMLESYSDTTHTPAIHNVMVDGDNNYYVCIMEKLEPLPVNTDTDLLAELCEYYCLGYIDSREFLKDIEHYSTYVPNPDKLLELLKRIKQVPNLQQDIAIDMHVGNFMLRKGVLVITDPFKDENMDDLEDLSDWASSLIDY